MSLKIKIRAASQKTTWFLGRHMPKTFPFVFVVGFPRSGTTWVCQLIAECLELPFPRYSLLPIGFPAVLHGHALMKRQYLRAVYVIRDGRDVMVSDYFQLTRSIAERENPPLTRHQRTMFPGLVDKTDIRSNLPAFMERQFTHPASCKHHWAAHVQSYFDTSNDGAVLLRYEDLIHRGHEALAESVGGLTGEDPDPSVIDRALEKYSFARQSGRRTGQEDRSAFLRRGKTGDWVNHFTREAAEVFDRHCGERLIQAGYESNPDWIESLDHHEHTSVPEGVVKSMKSHSQATSRS